LVTDLHLAAADIGYDTRVALEGLHFEEDYFDDCRNCAASVYHATFRGEQEPDDQLWSSVCAILRSDTKFRGTLELEELVRTSTSRGRPLAESALPPALPIRICPAGITKACDVHLAVRANDASKASGDWLNALDIASFSKHRTDGRWRIFTATFLRLPDGERFFDAVLQRIPGGGERGVNGKLERLVYGLRLPADAGTLPLTTREELDQWLRRLDHDR